MKIKLLGTGASEGIPAVFCCCPTCRKARALGGRELRSRCGAIIDDRLKIDFPPDTFHHILSQGLDMTDVASLLVTHTHIDHFDVKELGYRNPNYATTLGKTPTLMVYGNAEAGRKLSLVEENLSGRVAFRQLTAYLPADVDGYTVTALLADHKKDEESFLYLVEKDGRRLLYAHDTGEFPEPTYEYLAGRGIHLALMDCTFCGLENSRGHMGLPANRRVRRRLLQSGAVNDETVFVVNHFSHNGHMNHGDLVAAAAPEFLVAWDGMTLKV